VARDKKLARRKQAWIVFEDEFNWVRISIAAALAYRWDAARTRLYFQTRAGSYNEESLIEFVRELHCHFRGRQVILLWDGLPSHRSRLMSEFLQGHWLQVRRVPSYAPELNPVEGLWANLKGREPANRCETQVQRLAWVAQAGADGLRSYRHLQLAFLRHTGLQL